MSMSMPVSTPMTSAGMPTQFPAADSPVQNVQYEGSVGAAIAEAQRLLGQHRQQCVDQENTSLKSWEANRQRRMTAQYKSAEEEKSAASWKWVTQLCASGVSICGAAYSLYKVGQAGTAYKAAHRADAAERDQLQGLKAAGSEPELIDRARAEIRDKASEVSLFDHSGRKSQSRADTAQMFDRAGAGIAGAVGEWGSSGNQTKKKFLDADAQFSDSNAQLEMEIARRRAGDDAETRKRMDELNQSVAALVRSSASVFA